MTKAIGKALRDDIPPLFSDVILSTRVVKEFWWDLASPTADTKTRYLPLEAKVKVDFAQVMDKWLARGGK